MIKMEVRGLAEVQSKLNGLSKGLQDKVLSRALNKVADKAKAEINRLIPAEFNVKAADVRNAVTVRRARTGELQATITIFGSASKRGRSMNMIHFLAASMVAGKIKRARGVKAKDAKALGKQLGFMIKRGGGLKVKQGAFVGNMGRTIFIRTGDKRLPIKPVQVIGFSQMFSSRRISQKVMEKIRTELPTEVARSVLLLLEGRRLG